MIISWRKKGQTPGNKCSADLQEPRDPFLSSSGGLRVARWACRTACLLACSTVWLELLVWLPLSACLLARVWLLNCLLNFALSVCLPVWVSFQPVSLSVCRTACLPEFFASLPSCRSACLPAFWVSFHPACLPACFLSFLPPCLPASWVSFHPACLSAYLLSWVSCPSTCSPATLPPCFPACPLTDSPSTLPPYLPTFPATQPLFLTCLTCLPWPAEAKRERVRSGTWPGTDTSFWKVFARHLRQMRPLKDDNRIPRRCIRGRLKKKGDFLF